jgi:hypothetical protein
MDKQIFITTDLKAYAAFYDVKWANELTAQCRDTKLDRPFFDLCASWKGISNARQMPVMMINLFKSGVEGATRPYTAYAHRFTTTLRETIVARVPLSDSQRKSLDAGLQSIQAGTADVLQSAKYALDAEKLWEQFTQELEIRLSLWKSEEAAYVMMFFAYESFLASCVGIFRGNPAYRARRAEELGNDLETEFGKQVSDSCWRAELVTIARLVRNALLHNSGRLTRELEQYRSRIVVVERDEIGISAVVTNELATCLKSCVTSFMTQVVPSLR